MCIRDSLIPVKVGPRHPVAWARLGICKTIRVDGRGAEPAKSLRESVSEQSMHAPGALDGAPGDALARWQRWGWLPLLAGCAFIVIAVMVGSELYLDRNGGDTLAPSVHRFLIARGVIASALL